MRGRQDGQGQDQRCPRAARALPALLQGEQGRLSGEQTEIKHYGSVLHGCTADTQADEDLNQLNNNQKIFKLETFASDWT